MIQIFKKKEALEVPVAQCFRAAKIMLFALAFLTCADTMAQKLDYAALKTEYHERYEEEDLVITRLDRTFTFSYNAATQLMEVDELFEMEMLNLTDESSFINYPIFSDDYTEVEEIRLGRSKLKVAPEPYEMDGIFHHDSRVSTVSIFIPSRTEPVLLKYKKHYSDSKYLTRRYLSNPYPLVNSTLKLVYPTNAEVEAQLFHGDMDNITRTEGVENSQQLITFTATDLGVYESEGQSSGSAFYQPHVLILTKSIALSEGTVRLIADTQDLYGWYASLVKEVGNEPDAVAAFAAELVKDCADLECEKKTLYYWVQDNIRYFAFEDGIAGFRPEDCQSVFSQRYGDCKGMANLLTEMLKSRGVDARLTWIGTRSVPYDYSIPSLAVDNHMICTVIEADGSQRFLDATEKFISYDDIAERIQGRPVMIEDGADFIISNVPSFGPERNLEVVDIRYDISDDLLNGEFEYRVQGEGKVRMFNRYADISDKDIAEARRRWFSRGYTDLHIGEGNYTDLSDRDADIHWSAPFEARNRVNSFGSQLYLDWDIYHIYSKAGFTEEELEDLKGDLQFSSKVNDEEHYHIAPVDGYSVETLPEDFKVEDEHFLLDVDFSIGEDGSVSVVKRIVIPKATIPNEKLKLWSDSIERLDKEVYQSPIIYKKD